MIKPSAGEYRKKNLKNFYKYFLVLQIKITYLKILLMKNLYELDIKKNINYF